MAAAVARGGAKGVTVTGHSFMRLLRRAGRDEDSRLRTMNRRRRGALTVARPSLTSKAYAAAAEWETNGQARYPVGAGPDLEN